MSSASFETPRMSPILTPNDMSAAAATLLDSLGALESCEVYKKERLCFGY